MLKKLLVLAGLTLTLSANATPVIYTNVYRAVSAVSGTAYYTGGGSTCTSPSVITSIDGAVEAVSMSVTALSIGTPSDCSSGTSLDAVGIGSGIFSATTEDGFEMDLNTSSTSDRNPNQSGGHAVAVVEFVFEEDNSISIDLLSVQSSASAQNTITLNRCTSRDLWGTCYFSNVDLGIDTNAEGLQHFSSLLVAGEYHLAVQTVSSASHGAFEDPVGKSESSSLSVQVTFGPVPGDVNYDGVVDIRDMLLMQRAILGLTSLDIDQISRGDLYPGSGDGLITISDMLMLQALITQ
jgi:hypothetical protein